MKTSTFFKQAFLCLVIGFITIALSAQTIITIDNNPDSTTTYQTIQEALDNAASGDIIYVQPSGTTYGSATITKPVIIIGRSHSEPNRVSKLSSINIKSSNVIIKGLEFSGLGFSDRDAPIPPPFVGTEIFECKFSSVLLGYTNSTTPINVTDVKIRGNFITGNIAQYNDASGVLISNNIFTSSQPFSIYNPSTTIIANNIFKYSSTTISLYNYSTSATLLLYNNMFIFHRTSGDGNINMASGDFNLTNNLTYNYGSGTVNITKAAAASYLDSFTLANTDPLFTNVDQTIAQSFAGSSTYNPTIRLEDDLTLQASSQALTGGGGGSQIGLYNNGFIYKTLGNPRGVPTMDVVSYDGAVPKNGNINVTISAKAH